MAFVLEDGTGLTDSNSYCSVSEFQTYWTDRGFDYTAYTTGQQEIALIRATDHIELHYRSAFRGYRLVEDQALSFPRGCLYVDYYLVEGIPANLKKAVNEYAKRALDADLDPDLDDTAQPGGPVIIRESKKIGPIVTTRSFMPGGGRVLQPYPAADRWLNDYLTSQGGRIRA